MLQREEKHGEESGVEDDDLNDSVSQLRERIEQDGVGLESDAERDENAGVSADGEDEDVSQLLKSLSTYFTQQYCVCSIASRGSLKKPLCHSQMLISLI